MNRSESENGAWHLVRTKQYKEFLVGRQLARLNIPTYIPLLRIKSPRNRQVRDRLIPLFPGYVFAHFHFSSVNYSVQYLAGVAEVVSAGGQPLEVPPAVIAEIRRRSTNGAVELPKQRFQPADSVRVIEGPFQGLEAVFERYLSDGQRVALLLSVLGRAVRVIMNSHQVALAS